MAYALSPGVTVIEKDFTSIIPAVGTAVGAFAGKFQWGPTLYPIQLASENDLVAQFGKPSTLTFESFFTAANFLSYTAGMYICRSDSALGTNAVGSLDSAQLTAGVAPKINNVDSYNTSILGAANTSHWAAKYKGAMGNSLKVSFADSATFKDKALTGTISAISVGGTALTGAATKFLTELHIGAIIKDTASGTVLGTVTAIATDVAATITASNASSGSTIKADWAYYQQFDSAPGTSSYAALVNSTNDELHVIVIDEDGLFTGSAGTVLEKFAYVSKASDARKFDGTNNYYRDVINLNSKYIWWLKHTTNVDVLGTTAAWTQVAAGLTFKSLVGAMSTSLTLGLDDHADTGAKDQAAWSLYLDDSQYDISLLPVGKATAVTSNYVIQNIAEIRKDCMVFVSPQDNSTAAVITGFGSTATTAIATYRNALTSSSYAVMDTGYKYQYDRYNDLYRWVPLNGDIAGLTARTEYTNDAWWSPAGFNRGQIKNVVKLAVSPTKTDRDTLYQQGVNPVVAFPGQGVILYGDKTLLAKPSAFDRINVRRLFIILEKAIGKASKYQLFEFNDTFTRAQFKNMVEPFLRDVQGRRGITDFVVKCDTTNNTGEVIDRNEFVGDIFIKPARSISFITLNFIAARTGINFSEIGG
jgi:phage tail sheath protein FI